MKIPIARSGLLVLVLATVYLLWVFPRPAVMPIGTQSIVERPDGTKIVSYASGDGPYILLLASLGRSVSDFNEIIPALNEAGYRTLAVQSRGVGRSTMGHQDAKLTLFDLADDVRAALMADNPSDKNNIIIIGHAFGNRVARAYAKRYSESVQSIVLIASGGTQKLRRDQRVTQALLHSFAWWLPPPIRKRAIHFAFFTNAHKVPDSWMRGWYARGARLQIKAVVTTPVSLWRDGGGCAPIFILQGAQDRVAPAALTSARLKRDFPQRVRIVTIDQAGHALLPEQPTRIAKEIIWFAAQKGAVMCGRP
ncbi:MAG: alpha/beta fold hydrolase [Robiginitomaculum sp.]|nr:alpha/beta fold hydrolase [Robiginitomaculum sp.]